MPDVDSALGKVAASLTPRFRKAAIIGGWPHDVVSKLSLGHDDRDLVVNYDGPREDVERLEYGTPEDGPMPVINNFLGSHQVKKDVNAAAKEEMGPIVKGLL